MNQLTRFMFVSGMLMLALGSVIRLTPSVRAQSQVYEQTWETKKYWHVRFLVDGQYYSDFVCLGPSEWYVDGKLGTIQGGYTQGYNENWYLHNPTDPDNPDTYTYFDIAESKGTLNDNQMAFPTLGRSSTCQNLGGSVVNSWRAYRTGSYGVLVINQDHLEVYRGGLYFASFIMEPRKWAIRGTVYPL